MNAIGHSTNRISEAQNSVLMPPASPGGVSDLKQVSWTKRTGKQLLNTTVNSIGITGIEEIRSIVGAFSDLYQGPSENKTKCLELVDKINRNIQLAESVATAPQTIMEDSIISSLRADLDLMLREAEKINKLSSVVKGLNRAQLLQRLDALETALCRGKADLAFQFAIKSLSRPPKDEFPEPPPYNEVLLDNVDTIFTEPYTFKERDPISNTECTKSISVVKNQGQLVSLVEYSGTCSRKKKHELMMRDLAQCSTGRHANVLRLVGGSIPTTTTRNPYLVFQTGGAFDYVKFLKETASLHDVIVFINGVEQGGRYMYDQGVKYRDGISASHGGKAIVHPPGIKLQSLTGKQSTKRWAGNLLADIYSDFSGPTALPLDAVYEVLNASRGHVRSQVESAFKTHTSRVTKQKIFEIAAELNVPLKLTWRCVTARTCPPFVVHLASLGRIDRERTGGAFVPFKSWVPIYDQLGNLSTRDITPADWVDHITTRVTFNENSKPTFKDADIYQMKGSNHHQGWLSYENVMRNVKSMDSPSLVVLNYGNRPDDRLENYVAVFEQLAAQDHPPPMHAHGGIHFIYLHRRPGSKVPRDYWGFLSQFVDPTMTPESPVSNIEIKYQLDLVTALQGDSWQSRADAEYEKGYSKIPGAWQ